MRSSVWGQGKKFCLFALNIFLTYTLHIHSAICTFNNLPLLSRQAHLKTSVLNFPNFNILNVLKWVFNFKFGLRVFLRILFILLVLKGLNILFLEKYTNFNSEFLSPAVGITLS